MSISVKFFARLREEIGKDGCDLEAGMANTVAEIWSVTTGNIEMPSNTLMAVNMEYVDANTVVADGDEVAFFPPVTGG